jgi:hypothetical protein
MLAETFPPRSGLDSPVSPDSHWFSMRIRNRIRIYFYIGAISRRSFSVFFSLLYSAWNLFILGCSSRRVCSSGLVIQIFKSSTLQYVLYISPGDEGRESSPGLSEDLSSYLLLIIPSNVSLPLGFTPRPLSNALPARRFATEKD